jgi:cyclopropane fatty-acyl-phospholipid synthase-like methyltransferase
MDMLATEKERSLIDRFSRTYAHLTHSDKMLEIERAVCGCDYGCTSWTTREEADNACTMLALDSRKRLLEVGTGSGWPGLYLAKRSGCNVSLIDLPMEGLLAAKKRAEVDGMSDRCRVVQADGAALPFQSASFDAIYHSDVLCCLVEKQAVLNACRRVVDDTGTMVFSVILIAPGLSDEDYRRAAAGGPTFIESPARYPDMIERAGWNVIAHADLTAEYANSFKNMYARERANIGEFEQVHGPEGAADLMARRAHTLDALERNLLRREIFSVVPVGGASI